MNISALRAHPVRVQLADAYCVASEAFDSVAQIIVEIETDAGVTGIGMIHGRAVKEVVAALRGLEPLLAGMDALAHEAVWGRVFGLTTARPAAASAATSHEAFRASGRQTLLAALAGIDIALWDIKGKAAGMPVWRLLGGARRGIHAYASGGYYIAGKSPFSVVGEMAAYVQQGFRAVKMKVGGADLATDIERVKRVREAIGDADLMIDASRSYGFDEAVTAIRAFEPYGVFWYEEPLHWYDATRALARLARHTQVPFAAGESEMHFWACRDLVDLGGVRYLNFDATRNGGATEWLRIATYAHAHGALMTTHHDPQIQGHLVAGVANGYCVEAFADPARDPLWDTLFTHRAEIRKGELHLNDEPGFGFGIDWKTVARHRLA